MRKNATQSHNQLTRQRATISGTLRYTVIFAGMISLFIVANSDASKEANYIIQERLQPALFYTAPFRPESFCKSNDKKHFPKLNEDQPLSENQKSGLFDGVVPITNTLLGYFRLESASRLFEIDAVIIDRITGSMYFEVVDEFD